MNRAGPRGRRLRHAGRSRGSGGGGGDRMFRPGWEGAVPGLVVFALAPVAKSMMKGKMNLGLECRDG